MRNILLSLLLLWPGVVIGQNLPFVNWENPPVYPIDLSPDGQTLVVTNTADNRLEVFDLTTGFPRKKASVVVGIDPVSARFRTNSEVWVVNHISDSVSIVDLESLVVKATLDTLDEPADVVFAGSPVRAYVSCSAVDTIQVFNPGNLQASPQNVIIEAEDPRALAVSPDGMTVYAAIFESGNGTTVLAGGFERENADEFFPPPAVNSVMSPYAGVNPPPNSGTGFFPAMTQDLPEAPHVSQIVRLEEDGRWMDDNGADWTDMVSGANAGLSGRVPGWTLIDRDIAIIDTDTLEVTYSERLMNMGMAIDVNPVTGDVAMVGLEATNEIRFEPNINGTFVRVNVGITNAAGDGGSVSDINPHLDYQAPTASPGVRFQSLGDPRGIAFETDGSLAWVTGMGSNNLVSLDANGVRTGVPVEVGQGPTGIVYDSNREQLYVWNRFSADISVIDAESRSEIKRVAVFDPTPEAIRAGRPHFYDTHATSGLGQASCASCHVDGRTDRLAWDLGDPSGEVKLFNQNCQTDLDSDAIPCDDFHPMKGPMLTQTFQDIIDHEPFHWRGDRDGLEEFNGAFTGLMGRPERLTRAEMQQFEDFVATITIPPNPFRNLDNSLPTSLPLPGQFTTGNFGPEGLPLPDGNAVRGVDIYMNAEVDDPFECNSCHTLPTGLSSNGPLLLQGVLSIGGAELPRGPRGENHLGIVSVDRQDQRAFKTAQLRTLYDRVGMNLTKAESRAGFGFLHDGSVDSLARFVSEPVFELENDQQVADLVAMMMAFSGSGFPTENADNPGEIPTSQDTHAAVGTQLADDGGAISALLEQLRELAGENAIDLVVHGVENGEARGWLWNDAVNGLIADRLGESTTLEALRALASSDSPLTWTAVPRGLGVRLALDRDGDNVRDGDERDQGSDPADPASDALTPRFGMWYNPARDGHGIDLQRSGNNLFVVWYTYDETGAPVWYLAVGEYTMPVWTADLLKFSWPSVTSEVVGSLTMTFSDAESANFEFTVNGASASESFQPLVADRRFTPVDYTGHWFPPNENGYGFTVNMQGGLEFTVIYYYDAAGNPRWALGTSDSAGGDNTIDVLSYSGFCPTCEWVQISGEAAGSISHTITSPTEGLISTSVSYPGEEGGNWDRTGVEISSLSDPVMD